MTYQIFKIKNTDKYFIVLLDENNEDLGSSYCDKDSMQQRIKRWKRMFPGIKKI
jgi:hypothetical protein